VLPLRIAPGWRRPLFATPAQHLRFHWSRYVDPRASHRAVTGADIRIWHPNSDRHTTSVPSTDLNGPRSDG